MKTPLQEYKALAMKLHALGYPDNEYALREQMADIWLKLSPEDQASADAFHVKLNQESKTNTHDEREELNP